VGNLTEMVKCVKLLGMPVDEKRAAIHAAAIEVFSANGFAATSMGDIAVAAGVSRPALYQYFRDKGDIFASAFVALLDGQLDRALSSLTRTTEPAPSLADRLDGFLQRFDGDLWERMAASPHSDELLAAKFAQVGDEVERIMQRRRNELGAFLRAVAPGRRAELVTRRSGWVELLELAPKGFKVDRPSVATYRRRLHALAHSVAADIASGRPG
jgi:AcrR family transcriptional regulator